jgi:hypothetical protein
MAHFIVVRQQQPRALLKDTGLQSRPTTNGSTETPTVDVHVCANGPNWLALPLDWLALPLASCGLAPSCLACCLHLHLHLHLYTHQQTTSTKMPGARCHQPSTTTTTNHQQQPNSNSKQATSDDEERPERPERRAQSDQSRKEGLFLIPFSSHIVSRRLWAI